MNIHNIKSSAQQLTRKRELRGKARKGITLSATIIKSQQIKGFTECLVAFCRRYGIYCCKDSYIQFLEIQFQDIELSQLPKIFKLSLATFFSKELNQELPEGWDQAKNIFQPRTLRLLRKIYKRPGRKNVILWNLLQSKDLAEKVPSSMIQCAYEKHRRTLTAVGETPKYVLDLMRPYFREFAENVSRYVNDETKLPTRSAYFNCKKSSGGLLSYLKSQNRFRTGGHENRHSGDYRIDPVVLHLFGRPGVGKSFIASRLIRRLCERFGCLPNDYYSRSIATKHWDGYRNQLIAAIDDIFAFSNDEVDDEKEILQMCSNIDYILPMADIKEKGRKFTSDFLFLSSNEGKMAGMVGFGKEKFKDILALQRRVFPAFKIESKVRGIYQVQTFEVKHLDPLSAPPKVVSYDLDSLLNFLLDFLITEHRKRRETPFISQTLLKGDFGEPGITIQFPITPPETLPKVMAHAIPEPLKVRIITKGEEDNWVLKPIQIAMWRSLQDYPCFKLTGTPTIPLNVIESWNGTHFLSGDYESATDNLNMDVMHLMIDELKKTIPTSYHKWLEWEGGIHEIHYPKDSGLTPVLQTRGQLMGSLLSFPILCVANACTIGIVKKKDLHEIPALINGDDILFKGFLREIKSWKKISSCMGLIPSIGKNFISPDWGTINSQMITKIGNICKHTATGSFGPTGKVNNYLQCLTEAIRVDPEHLPSYVTRAKAILKRTPQSVDISTDFGGIGPMTTKKPTLQDKEIYFFKLLRKSFDKVVEIDDSQYWRIPRHLYKMYGKVLFAKGSHAIPEINSEVEELPDRVFPYKEFRQFQKWYKTNPDLRIRINNSSLEGEIPLTMVKPILIKIPKTFDKIIENLKIRI